MIVSASSERTVKPFLSEPASINPKHDGPRTIPRTTKISAGARYQRRTSPETAA